MGFGPKGTTVQQIVYGNIAAAPNIATGADGYAPPSGTRDSALSTTDTSGQRLYNDSGASRTIGNVPVRLQMNNLTAALQTLEVALMKNSVEVAKVTFLDTDAVFTKRTILSTGTVLADGDHLTIRYGLRGGVSTTDNRVSWGIPLTS